MLNACVFLIFIISRNLKALAKIYYYALLCQLLFSLSAATLVCGHRALLQRKDRREQTNGKWQRALLL